MKSNLRHVRDQGKAGKGVWRPLSGNLEMASNSRGHVPAMNSVRGGSKGRPGSHSPQSEVWPTAAPNEIFGKCKWTHGMKN